MSLIDTINPLKEGRLVDQHFTTDSSHTPSEAVRILMKYQMAQSANRRPGVMLVPQTLYQNIVCHIRTMRIYLRNMRKQIDALFPKTKQGLLAALVMHPEKWWYLSDLAKHLRTSPSSVQRELRTLVEAGILKRRTEGKRVYFRPDEECPFLPELQGIFLKTTGLVDVLKGTLKSLTPKVDFAFIYGSIARGEELSRSDVDLFVVGRIGLADLAPKLKEAEKRLLREVNPVTYAMNEFKKKVRSKDHFVTTVIKSKKLFLHGEDEYLETIGR